MWTPNISDIVTAEHRAVKQDESMRLTRNALLAASDWVVIRSTEIGEPISEKWLKYRKALRDFPTEPQNWPKKPS